MTVKFPVREYGNVLQSIISAISLIMIYDRVTYISEYFPSDPINRELHNLRMPRRPNHLKPCGFYLQYYPTFNSQETAFE